MSGLNIDVLRGTNQIGGNLISVSCEDTTILLDAGEELEVTDGIPPQAEALSCPRGYAAVFVTHYHRDHLGLVYRASPDIPFYLGRKAWAVQTAADQYKSQKPLHPAGFLEDRMPIQIGPITVTPYLCDHSAFDSYMLLVEGTGNALLYTGDFRGHGRKSFSAFLKRLPNKVGTLICEGTTLSRPEVEPWSEERLEKRVGAILSQTAGPAFALFSSTNLDRVVTFYKAAKRTRRIFLEDLYLAELTSAAGGSVPHPGSFPDVKVFLPRGYSEGDPNYHRYLRYSAYGSARIGKGAIPVKSLICVRASMLPWIRSLGERLPLADGVLFYSMWSGYREKTGVSEFLTGCRELGLREETLHTSGHAGQKDLKALIKRVKPNDIIPVHTLNPGWFTDEYGG